ncbi:MAG: peptidylprolyl isomerase [bacterium]|nr:peptidylprolyl isomerase [bacterium]
MVAILLISGLLSAAPNDSNKVIAKVGTEVITMAEFNKVYQPGAGTNIDSLKNKAMEQLVTNKLMLVDAKAKRFDTLTTAAMTDLTNRLTINALYEKIVLQKVKTPRTWILVKEWHRMTPTLKISQMTIKDKDTAIKVYKELRKGKSFTDLAVKYSEDYSAKYGGGGTDITRGSGDKEIEKIAFSLHNVGAFSRPIPSPMIPWHRKIFAKPSAYPVQNYRIIKLNEKINKPLPEFSKEKDKIIEKLKGEQTRKLSDGYLKYLKTMARMRYNRYAMKKIIKNDIKESDKSTALVKWTGGVITVDDFKKKADMEMARGRKFDNEKAIKDYMDGWLIFEKFLPAAAARYKFDQRDDIKKQLVERQEVLLIQQYREKEINAKCSPTEEELKTYYDKNKTKYEKKPLEQVKARVSWDLEQEKRTAKEAEMLADLRSKIPVQLMTTAL